MSIHIAIDIGGTQMRAASYTINSLEPQKIHRIPSQIPGVKPQQRLVEVIQSVWPEKGRVEGIGIAVAGPLDLETGLIQRSPNIPAFDNFPIVNFLVEKFNVPVFLGNDANLAALGEWRHGSGQGHENIIYLTISTGIGSGVISDNKLLLGSKGMAAELGHVIIFPDGPICSCGKRGHLEAVASGTAIAKWTREQIEQGENSTLINLHNFNAKNIAEEAYRGDALALSAFRRAGEALGIAIINFLVIFNPTCIIFGGGVSKSIDLLLPHIKVALETKIFEQSYCRDLRIKTAALGDDAGLLGALVLAREALS